MILVLPAGQGAPGRRDFDSQTSGAQLLPVMSSLSLGRKRELFEHLGGTPQKKIIVQKTLPITLSFFGDTPISIP